VRLIGREFVGGGYVTVLVRGETGAVNAAGASATAWWPRTSSPARTARWSLFCPRAATVSEGLGARA